MQHCVAGRLGRLHTRLAGHQLQRWLRVTAVAARPSAAPAGSGAAATAATAAARPTNRPSAGDVLELTCSDLAFGGEGVCRLPGGYVVFVDRALPGERLTARVVQSKRSFAKAAKLSTLQLHDDAVEPVCQHFGPCGGCSLQNLRYEVQLAAKYRQVADLLRRTAGVADADLAGVLRPAVGCPPQQGSRGYGTRNKMEFSFSAQEWQPQPGQPGSAGGVDSVGGRRRSSSSSGSPDTKYVDDGFALGLHRPGCDTAVLPIAACHLQPDAANVLLERVAQLCRQAGLQAFDPATGAGLLQHLVIRRSGDGGSSSGSDASSKTCSGRSGGEDYLINIVTSADGRTALAPLAAALMAEPLPAPGGGAGPAPSVVGVVNSVSQKGRPAGERRVAAEYVLAGRGHLLERLCGLEFEVSANSFFQTYTAQAEVLYGLVAAAAELWPSDILCDLYCGTGSIGLSLASGCSEVHGVEISAAAVADAERNAGRNGIQNATFLQGDLAKLQLEGRLPCPDVVVVDPARPGLSPAVIAYLRSCGARRVVYVSCNASTQARDIKMLCAPPAPEADSSGEGPGADVGSAQCTYRLVSVQPVDMYPQTWHVETVAVLDAVPCSR